jgi:hypothetical protein
VGEGGCCGIDGAEGGDGDGWGGGICLSVGVGGCHN